MCKKNNLTRHQQLLLSTGCILATSSAFIHGQFPGVPDFFIGLFSGSGLGLMIGVGAWRMKLRRE